MNSKASKERYVGGFGGRKRHKKMLKLYHNIQKRKVGYVISLSIVK